MNQFDQKILIIEDSPGDFFLITDLLKKAKLPQYDIHQAETVKRAVDKLSVNEYTLIFIDLFLPDSEGIITFQKIFPLSGRAPVIVLTGLVNEEVTLDTLKFGAQDYLIKGEFDVKLLEKTIRYALERKRNQELVMRSEEDSRRKLEALVRERTKELNEALKKEKQLVELKNQFVAIASHEFRTPLSTIRFAADYLHEYLERLNAEEVRRKLKKIQTQVIHMTALLEDVILAGRPTINKPSINKSDIDIRMVIDKIIEEVLYSTKNTHTIIFSCHLTDGLVQTDEKLLRNIFINLLTNAIKFSPDQKRVDLSIQQINDRLIVDVKDYGIGIIEQEQEKLFEPFYRGSNAATITGTGLGLSIVKRATELLDGDLQLESRVGSGTHIKISLPITPKV